MIRKPKEIIRKGGVVPVIPARTFSPALLGIGIFRKTCVVNEVVRLQRSIDGFKLQWRLVEIETVAEIISSGIGVTERAQTEDLLDEIQDGSFATRWILENQAGRPSFQAMRRSNAQHQIEHVGRDLRAMMPWLNAPTKKPEIAESKN